MEFIRKFLIDGFVKGDYTFGFVHIGSIVLLIASIIVSIILLRGKDSKYVHNKMKYIASFTLVVYFVRRGVMIYEGTSVLKALWPFYLCNINTILLSFYILFGWKKGKDFFIITGMFGAALMFIVPDGVFTDKYLNLRILDSLLSHFTIIYIPVVLLSTRAYELNIKNAYQVLIGYALILFNVEIIQRWMIGENVDYLFIRGTLPFTIDGVPQVFIMIFCAVVAMYLVYFVNYLALGKMNQFIEDIKIKAS